jgi:hypothetical protein
LFLENERKKEFSVIEIKMVQEMNNIRIMASAVTLAELSSFYGYFCMFCHHNLKYLLKVNYLYQMAQVQHSPQVF